MLALVLPGEAVALPDVGPTLAAGVPAGAAFEAVAFAGGVGVGRRGLAEEPAEVDEVLLGGGALLELGGAPFGDELAGGDGAWIRGRDGGLLGVSCIAGRRCAGVQACDANLRGYPRTGLAKSYWSPRSTPASMTSSTLLVPFRALSRSPWCHGSRTRRVYAHRGVL